MLSSIPSVVQNKAAKNDIPDLSIPDTCQGCLSGAPGDITYRHCRQKKRGTSHINIKPLVARKSRR